MLVIKKQLNKERMNIQIKLSDFEIIVNYLNKAVPPTGMNGLQITETLLFANSILNEAKRNEVPVQPNSINAKEEESKGV